MPKNQNPLSIFQKLIFSIGGFLIGMLVIVIFLKLLSNFWGVLIGIIVDIAFFYYLKKKKISEKEKISIAYGILAAAIFTAIAGTGIWIFIEIAFQDIAG